MRHKPWDSVTSMIGAVVPGLLAGLIFFVIAFTTGTSAATSPVGGLGIAVIAIAISRIFRAVYKRGAR